MHLRLGLFAGLSLFLFAAPAARSAAPAEDTSWPQFRGPGARGIGTHPRLPDRWSTRENVAWNVPIPGRGWSSPITWRNRIFLTTSVTDAASEPPRKGLYFGGERMEVPTTEHRWIVLGLDLETGRELWRREAHRGAPPTPLHVKNTYASETPVTDGERVYAYFGNVGVFCYDLEGHPLWSVRWPPVKTRYGWGSAASPVLHGDRLFVVNDNDDASFAVALDTRTGKELWRIPRDEKSNWATPCVWQNGKRNELVVPGTRKVRSYDLDGRLLWEFGGMSTITIPTPLAEFGLLYVCSGYVGDKIRPVFAIKPGASGDITLEPGQTNQAHVAWYQPLAGPYNPSPLVYGDYLYVLFDFGFLACHDARTGRPVYEKQRIRTAPTAFTASPWAANGRLYALSP
jgi:outer membrane protein assembly factor BamB